MSNSTSLTPPSTMSTPASSSPAAGSSSGAATDPSSSFAVTSPASTSQGSTSTPLTTSSISSSSSSPSPSSSSSSSPPPSSSSSSSISSSSSSSSHQSASSTTTVQPSSASLSTSVVSLSSVPATTDTVTSVIVVSTGAAQTPSTAVVVVTSTRPEATVSVTPHVTSSSSTSTTSTAPTALNNTGEERSGGSGLSTGGITAIAVVVPVVAVALLVLAGIFLWRKRKQKKDAEEARRKEVEDYGFNPNNDPTLPTVASESGQEMLEDQSSGYRGWGAAAASNRKMSTTLSAGHTQGQLSDAGSNQYQNVNTPSGGASDGHSGDPLVAGGGNAQRDTMMSDDLGSLGQAPLTSTNQPGMKRGPSNASSTYSAGHHSDVSDVQPGNGLSQSFEAYNPNGFGYSQHGPYGDGSYGGQGDDGMPVVRDVSARRNTRIQQPGNYQQGNSGIAQNF